MAEETKETFNELMVNLTGLTKLLAIKILNNDFAEEVKRILNNYGVENANDALKKLVETAVQKVANGIRWKIAIISNIIVGIFAILAIIVLLAASGNIVIPIVIAIILIAIIWFATGAVTKLIVRRVASIILKEIKSKITQFAAKN
ncbi:MAG: hypothetical protein LBC75_11485 [Fibromonadaceae bacterium]|jgi:hypothetical protein|nr:hypothetical protein [Fibromonadaceae bacterium]